MGIISSEVLSIETYKDNILVGGDQLYLWNSQSFGGQTMDQIYKSDKSYISSMVSVEDCIYCATDNRIMMYCNGNTIEVLHVDGHINVLAYDNITGRLYFGGKFTALATDTIGQEIVCKNIAYIDLFNEIHSINILDYNTEDSIDSLNGLDLGDEVCAIHLDSQYVYIGGIIKRFNNICRWSRSDVFEQFTDLNSSLNNKVLCIKQFDNYLIVGGQFDKHIKKYNMNTYIWEDIVNGVDSIVRTIEICDSDMFIGSGNNVIKYDINLDHYTLLDYADGPINVIKYHLDKLYIGGSFKKLGNFAAENIGIYDCKNGWFNSLPTCYYIDNDSNNNLADGSEYMPINFMEAICRSSNNSYLIYNNVKTQVIYTDKKQTVVLDKDSNKIYCDIDNSFKNIFYLNDSLKKINDCMGNSYDILTGFYYGQYDGMEPVYFNKIAFKCSFDNNNQNKDISILRDNELVKVEQLCDNNLNFFLSGTNNNYYLGRAIGDTKIITTNFIKYMTNDNNNCFRLVDYLKGNRLIINCSIKKLELKYFPDVVFSHVHKEEMRKQLLNLDKNMYYDKIFISYKNTTCEINMDTLEYALKGDSNIIKIYEKKRNFRNMFDDGFFVYPMHDTSKYIKIKILLDGDEYIVFDCFSDYKADDRSCIYITETNIKNSFRGLFYKESDSIVLKRLHDLTNYFTINEIDPMSKINLNRLRALSIKSLKTVYQPKKVENKKV